MATLTFRHVGNPITKPDVKWRRWAYETARATEFTPVRAAHVTLIPYALNTGNRPWCTTLWQTFELMIDGLCAAGVFADRHPSNLASVTIQAGQVRGCTGFEIVVDGEP